MNVRDASAFADDEGGKFIQANFICAAQRWKEERYSIFNDSLHFA
jgi:hypothetical protein